MSKKQRDTRDIVNDIHDTIHAPHQAGGQSDCARAGRVLRSIRQILLEPAPAPNASTKKTWNDFSGISIPHVSVNGSTITFQIQDGPIKEVGVNGCQIDALGEAWLNIITGFNEKFPCRENAITITKIEEALLWQQKRKQDRVKRGVEGHGKQ